MVSTGFAWPCKGRPGMGWREAVWFSSFFSGFGRVPLPGLYIVCTKESCSFLGDFVRFVHV